MRIRNYQSADYDQLKALYLDSSTFGGQFDEARDASDRLQKKIEADPDAILVAELENKIVGTVSLIDDGRVAWLFRFAVKKRPSRNTKSLARQGNSNSKEPRAYASSCIYACW